MIEEPDFVVVGRVRRAHGTAGEVTVEHVSDFPERLRSLREVLVRSRAGEVRVMEVEGARPKGELTLLKLAGVDDRTAAEAFAGALVGLRREDLPPAGEDRYYHFDLIGMAVVDEQGVEVGAVSDVLRMPANDVLVVDTGGGEALIPTVKAVVKRVDLDARTITIERMPGLLDQ